MFIRLGHSRASCSLPAITAAGLTGERRDDEVRRMQTINGIQLGGFLTADADPLRSNEAIRSETRTRDNWTMVSGRGRQSVPVVRWLRLLRLR